jgi:AcrR family transcriptional regulator
MTRKQQKDDTRERVRRAALELFSSTGFEATTTKAVAERAGVAVGTVFVHASDKVDLLALVMHDVLHDALSQAFETLPKAALEARLLHVFGSVFRAYGQVPRLAEPFVRTIANATGPNGSKVNAFTFETLGRLAALVSEAQHAGEIDENVPPLLLAQNVFALYYFALTTWISGYSTLETALDPHLRLALELQLRGLLKQPGPVAAGPVGAAVRPRRARA